MLRLFKLAIACLLLSNQLSAQPELRTWVLGASYPNKLQFNKAGITLIRFTYPLYDLNEDSGTVRSANACSQACDSNGKLLLFANADLVYNSVDTPMDNSFPMSPVNSGIFKCPRYQNCGPFVQVGGNPTVIIPSPVTSGEYFVFYSDFAARKYANGLRYARVLFSSQFPKGRVIFKSNILTRNVTYEYIIAIKGKKEGETWIVTKDKNDIDVHSFLLRKDGSVSGSIKSSLNFKLPLEPYLSDFGGNWKASPDNKWIIQRNHESDSIQFMSFNNKDGKCKTYGNLVQIGLKYGAYLTSCEFSPESRYFLFSNYYKGIIRFRLPLNSEEVVPIDTLKIPGSVSLMKLAPDGRGIFVQYVDTNKLSNPYGKNTIHFAFIPDPDALPGKMQFIPEPPINYLNINTFHLRFFPNIPSYLFINNLSSWQDCSNDTVTLFTTSRYDTSTFSAYKDGIKVLQTGVADSFYFTGQAPGRYKVIAISQRNGSIDTFTKYIDYYPLNKRIIPTHDTICEGNETLTLLAGRPWATILWDDSSTNQARTFSLGGTYWVKYTKNECTHTDTLHLFGRPPLPKPIKTSVFVCSDERITLKVNDSGTTRFRWNDGDMLKSTRTFTGPGVRYVDRYYNCGIVRDSFLSFEHPKQTLVLPFKIYQACSIDSPLSVMVTVTTTGTTGVPIWSTGTRGYSEILRDTALTYVSLSGPCGTLRDSVRVSFEYCTKELVEKSIALIPNAFSPNSDGINESFTLPAFLPKDAQLQIWSRWGSLIYTGTSWNGNFADGTQAPSSVYLYTIKVKVGRPMILKGNVMLLR